MSDTLVGVIPLHDWVFVDIYDNGEGFHRFAGGQKLILLDDSMLGVRNSVDVSHPGARDRWGIIVAVNDDAEKAGLRVGQKVLMEKMKWTRSFPYTGDITDRIWAIRHTDILGIDEDGFNQDEREVLEEKYPEVFV